MPRRAPTRCHCGEWAVEGRTQCQRHIPTRPSGWVTHPTAWKRLSPKLKRRWKRLRDRFIRENPLCAHCGGVAEEVDHIYGINDILSSDTLLDEERLQSLCKRCHRVKTEGARKSGGEPWRATPGEASRHMWPPYLTFCQSGGALQARMPIRRARIDADGLAGSIGHYETPML